MAEASTSSERKPETQGDSAARSGGVRQERPLQTEHGHTTISDAVVTKVASTATREVRGVHDLGGGIARTVAPVTQRVGVADERTQGVSVDVGEREAAIDLTIVIEYGESIPKVSQAVRENVIRRIEGITGLAVTEVNVTVNDLYFPGDEVPDQPRVQ
jgi:uncharacterized alkaline shock family protein YloU